MADPLSIASGVVAIATVAYNSSKSLYQIISGIRDPPQNLVCLKADVEGLYRIIESLQYELEKNSTDATLSDAQKSDLLEIEPTLEGCHKACDAFQDKIQKLTSHSSNDHIALRDRIKLHIQEKEIITFRAQVGSYRSTLTIARDFTILKKSARGLKATKALETRIEDFAGHFTSQMQGLHIGLQTILDTSFKNNGPKELNQQSPTEARQSKTLHALEQQTTEMCQALQGTTKEAGHDYKYVTASNEARLLMGDLGKVTSDTSHTFSNIDIKGGWVVAGNMDGESAKDFFK